MTPAGRAVIERAQADGSWTRLDDVEALVVPPDLAAAFAERPGALERWDAFPRTAKMYALGEIARAKRPETRRQRVERTADLAASGVRPFPTRVGERTTRSSG
jgi:uncharacterized protein YdeI (YjbR/CyaY-like superfamily)